MTKEEEHVLYQLKTSGWEWHRPMDVGGSDASQHSAILNRLVKRGFVERRKRNTLANMLGGRGSYEYRATQPQPERHE